MHCLNEHQYYLKNKTLNIFCVWEDSKQKYSTGIPRFTLLMWGLKKKNRRSKNRVNQGYLVVLKGRKIG